MPQPPIKRYRYVLTTIYEAYFFIIYFDFLICHMLIGRDNRMFAPQQAAIQCCERLGRHCHIRTAGRQTLYEYQAVGSPQKQQEKR